MPTVAATATICKPLLTPLVSIPDPFCHQLKYIDEEYRQPIIDVVDTFNTVQLGLKSLGIDDPFVVLEAVKIVLQRYDKQRNQP